MSAAGVRHSLGRVDAQQPSGGWVDGCAQPAGEGAGTPGNLTPRMPDGDTWVHSSPSSWPLPLRPLPHSAISLSLPGVPWLSQGALGRIQAGDAPAATRSFPHLHPHNVMGAPSRSASLPQPEHRSLSPGTLPRCKIGKHTDTFFCHETFLYHPGMLGQWGYFGHQVRDGARAMAVVRRWLWVCGSQHPLCTEMCPLNSCVQVASCRCAYGASGFSQGFLGTPQLPVVCNILPPSQVPAPPARLGLMSPECPAAVTGESQGVNPGPCKLGVPHISPEEQTVGRVPS